MDYATIEGERKPRILITPYIHTTMIECSLHYVVYSEGKATVLKKKDQKYYLDELKKKIGGKR